LIDSAHARNVARAVCGPPVNVIFCTFGCSTSRAPASTEPGSTLTTPLGMPACATSSAKSSGAKGVSSGGFTTTVLPAASAAGTFMAIEDSAAFHVVIAPITPYG
jgi:hypothetical protein